MANYIVKMIKNPDDPNAPKIPTTNGVILCLRSGEKQLGEIRKFLSENGAEYTKPGLIGLLKRLMKKKWIRKHMPKNGKYQTYYITPKIKNNIPLLAKMFAIEASNVLLKKEFVTLDQKTILKNLIQQIGFYTVFNYLYSWNIRKEHSNRLQVEWLENVLPMRRVSSYLTGHDVWKSENATFQFKGFQKALKSLYPFEYNECESLISNLENDTTNFFQKRSTKESAIKIIEDL